MEILFRMFSLIFTGTHNKHSALFFYTQQSGSQCFWCTQRIHTHPLTTMDDSCVDMTGSLQSLKGKAWSSLQHLFPTDSSEEFEECNDNRNIGLNQLHNGQYSSPLSSLPPHPSATSSSSSLVKNQLNGELGRSTGLNRTKSESMKLKREDMCLYGHRPAFDPFYLVVCEHCGHVIKPQALSKHIELRHRPKKKGAFGEHKLDPGGDGK